MTGKKPDGKESVNIVAIIFPQSGGYMARLLPIGIDCYSETLDGLHEEISKVIRDYHDYIDVADLEDWYGEDIGFATLNEKLPTGKGSYFIEISDDWLH